MQQEIDAIKIDTEEMNTEPKADFPSKSKKSKKKIYIIIAIVVLAIAVVVGFLFIKRGKDDTELMNMEVVKVTRRSIQNTVTGSSVLEPKDSYSVTARVTGEILSDTFSEGDVVKKGKVLYRVDDESARKSVTSAQNALKKSQRNYSNILEDSGNLNVKSDTSGKVSEVLVKVGDNVNSGTKIANTYSDTYMKIELPFNENDAKGIVVGEYAAVTIAGTGDEIGGSVTHISTASASTSSHAVVRYVTIEVENPGALTTNDSGTAIVGDVACADAANFEYISEGYIVAETSGEVSELYIKNQDKVSKGQTVAKLTSEDIAERLEDAKIDVDEAQMKLDNAKDTLEDYTITAPIDGTIVVKNKKAGDNMMNGSNSADSNSMAEIYDLSSLKFQISIDETEVQKVKTGQTVSVSADAVAGTFEGVVTKVGIDGTSSNGVTTYPVDVEIKEYGTLLPGMNITAEIVVEEAVDVLAIPVSAVMRGSIVYVKDDGTLPAEGKSDEAKTPENMPQMPSGEMPQMPSGERPQMPSGERPQMPEGERPQMPSGERPQMPEGERPQMPEGERPQMPSGERPQMPSGERPQMPEGERPQMPSGERPQMPEGERPQMPEGERPQPTQEQGSAENKATENKTDSDKTPQGNDKANRELPANMRMKAPEGYRAVVVVLGINDLEYIEVISGLTEGQEVLVQSVASSGKTNNQQQMMPGMGGGMPGMGGGMPGMGGGMPAMGGGMSGMGGMRSGSMGGAMGGARSGSMGGARSGAMGGMR